MDFQRFIIGRQHHWPTPAISFRDKRGVVVERFVDGVRSKNSFRHNSRVVIQVKEIFTKYGKYSFIFAQP